MDRTEKQQWVQEFKESTQGAEILILTHYKGLNVAEISDLRAKARECGAKFKVTKNSLAKLALQESDFSGLVDQLSGPTAIAYADDPVAAAKVIAEFSKDHEQLVLLGASFAGNVLDANGIKELAKLPSLDELRAKIIALLNTPATRIAGVTQAPAGQLARVFGAYGSSQS